MTNDDQLSPADKIEMNLALEQWRVNKGLPEEPQDEECGHDDLDGFWCLSCNKDVSDWVISRAEAAADSREDR